MRYSEGFKRSIVKKFLVPNPPSVYAVGQDTGISVQTIYKWRRTLKDSVPMAEQEGTPEDWSLPEKSETLLVAAGLSSQEASILQKVSQKTRYLS